MTEAKKTSTVLEQKDVDAILKLPEADRPAAMKQLTDKVNADVNKLVGAAMEEAKTEEAKRQAETTANAPENTAEHPANHVDPNQPPAPTPEEAERARLDAEEAAAEQEAANHPAALTGKEKMQTIGTVGAITTLATMAGNSVPMLRWWPWLQTQPLATIPYNAAQAAMAPLIASVGTVPAFLLAGAGTLAGLGVIGKTANTIMRGAYALAGKEHKNTGLSPGRNIWYGAKTVTSPIWVPWECLKWIGRTARENIPGMASATGRRIGHEARHAVQWGVGGAAIAGGFAAMGAFSIGGPAGYLVFAGLGYGGNVLYRVWNRVVNKEPSTLSEGSNGYSADSHSAAHADDAHPAAAMAGAH